MNNTEYIVIEKSSYHVPGDERSRTHPGHGYPAHDVDTDNVVRFSTLKQLEAYILAHADQDNLEVYKVQPVKIVKHVKVTIS